jgi:hypothetical protein
MIIFVDYCIDVRALWFVVSESHETDPDKLNQDVVDSTLDRHLYERYNQLIIFSKIVDCHELNVQFLCVLCCRICVTQVYI